MFTADVRVQVPPRPPNKGHPKGCLLFFVCTVFRIPCDNVIWKKGRSAIHKSRIFSKKVLTNGFVCVSICNVEGNLTDMGEWWNW